MSTLTPTPPSPPTPFIGPTPRRFPLTTSEHPITPFPTTPSLSAPTVTSLTFLGTGSAIPSPRRSTSALAVSLSSGSVVLLDCGEGAQLQLHRCRISPARIDAILITHLHGDHFFGLFGLLSTMSACGRVQPVTIVAPPPLRAMVEAVLGGAGGLELPLRFIPLEEGRAHDVGLVAGLHVQASPLQHRVPAFAYTLTEQKRPGSVLAERARELGVVGPQMRQLKDGQSVVTPMGVVQPADCVADLRSPFRMALVQDCSDCSAAYPTLQGVDLLIHECTYEAGWEEKAAGFGHSTSTQAGRVAREVGAKALILTHFSARYELGQRNGAELESRSSQGTEQREGKDEEKGEGGRVEKTTTSADDLVEQAMAGYRAGGDDVPSIPVWAAEDLLVFRTTHGVVSLHEFAAELERVVRAGSARSKGWT